MAETSQIERRRTPRFAVEDRTATIGFRTRVRLLDLSVNGVQLGVADDGVTVGTRAWLTAVIGTTPLSVSVEVRRAVPPSEDEGPAVGGQLRCDCADSMAISRFVSRGN